jgi:hypothetical protein
MATEINTSANASANVPRPDDIKAQAEAVIAAATIEAQAKIANDANIKKLSEVKTRSNTSLDFSKITEDDIYNLEIPMEAKPFSTEDSLIVELKDPAYVARWVNKDGRRLGAMISKGFIYVTAEDLAQRLKTEVVADAEDHYIINDVVLMKISKDIYFPALRAAHLRAVNTVNPKLAMRAARMHATEFLSKDTDGAFNIEQAQNKIDIYTPGVEI